MTRPGSDRRETRAPRSKHPTEAAKRTFDVAFSAILVVVLMPVWLPAAVAILLTDGRPLFFQQERIGRGGSPFTMFKFRSMLVDNDDTAFREMNQLELSGDRDQAQADDGLFKLENDPRITRVGRFMRRYSLDELPQLLNVLRGDMSIVGPRPSLRWEVELFTDEQLRRHAVRPGLTGLWQVSGRNRLSMPEMLQLDVDYAEHWTLLGDLGILARTPLAVLRGDGAR